IFNLFKAFASKGYTWHAAEGDFRWLKYKGPETDPYSIRVEIITDEWEP
ncbi:MAG: hypothetical protein HQ558_03610, partial [Candidatus Omnitrophica bacterium]|nr:hypothetical protein [Candidatus Omnitrophota bacterium]